MAIYRFWLNPFCEESFLRKAYQNGMLGVNRSIPICVLPIRVSKASRLTFPGSNLGLSFPALSASGEQIVPNIP